MVCGPARVSSWMSSRRDSFKAAEPRGPKLRGAGARDQQGLYSGAVTREPRLRSKLRSQRTRSWDCCWSQSGGAGKKCPVFDILRDRSKSPNKLVDIGKLVRYLHPRRSHLKRGDRGRFGTCGCGLLGSWPFGLLGTCRDAKCCK